MTTPLVTMEMVRKAIVERLECALAIVIPDGVKFYWDRPASLDITPAVFIQPDKPYTDPVIGFGSGSYSEYRFLLTVYADAVDEEVGQSDLDAIIAAIIAALKSDDYDDTLQALTNGYVQPIQGYSYDPAIADYTNYLSTQIKMLCRA